MVRADLFSGSLAVWNLRRSRSEFIHPHTASRAKRGEQTPFELSSEYTAIQDFASGKRMPRGASRAARFPLQTCIFPTGGVCLKISERNWLGSAGGIPPTPPFRPPRLEPERKGRFQVFLASFCWLIRLRRIWRQILSDKCILITSFFVFEGDKIITPFVPLPLQQVI